MIVSDYDIKLPSAAVLKSTLNPVSTTVSATNLTFDGVQDGKSRKYHLCISNSTSNAKEQHVISRLQSCMT